jgi:hypothetical protein
MMFKLVEAGMAVEDNRCRALASSQLNNLELLWCHSKFHYNTSTRSVPYPICVPVSDQFTPSVYPIRVPDPYNRSIQYRNTVYLIRVPDPYTQSVPDSYPSLTQSVPGSYPLRTCSVPNRTRSVPDPYPILTRLFRKLLPVF